MRRRVPRINDRPSMWVLAAVVTLVVVGAAALLTSSAGDEATDNTADGFGILATVVDPLGRRGTPSGEGLTRPELAAAVRTTATADGGGQVPIATVDGPGRRIFAGVSVKLPSAKTPLVLRLVLPEDLQQAETADGAFVRWQGYVAVLTSAQARGRVLPAPLSWAKVPAAGLSVPAGSTVRLRTMFRIPNSAGACRGPQINGTPFGHRARQVLRRAPAWMVQLGRPRSGWQWLRSEDPDTPGLARAVRSGPVRSVLFRGSHVCRDVQTMRTVDPDPDPLSTSERAAGAQGLPLDAPDRF